MTASLLVDQYYLDLGIFLYLIPIVSAFWAAFALVANKNKYPSQKYLAICLATVGLGMVFSFWYDRYTATDHTEILRAINLLNSIFCAITILFYITSLMQPHKLTRKYILYHILFAVIFSSIILILESICGGIEYTLHWENIFENITQPVVIVRLLALFVLITIEIYVAIIGFKMYYRHRKHIRESYSYEEDIDLNWIGWCIAFFITFALSDLFWMINSSVISKILFGILAFIAIVMIFWLGFRQEEVPTIEENTMQDRPNSIEKTVRNIQGVPDYSISSGKREKIKQDLLEYFEKEKPYLNPELNLGDIALALHTNKTYLSQLINGEFNVNFYTFVNQYRIQHVIKLITEQQDDTLQSGHLYNESGFKSRSVFYKLFRETTGSSPSDYIQRRGLV